MARSTKYIFVTGGVVSSLGKGLAAASIGALMEDRGLCISLLKMDPYLNVDPGTMSPLQHGEVFVTDDGAETDLDLGHYERFTSVTMKRGNNFTSGQVYERVIENERNGVYLGRTVQVIPHVTDEIKRRIRENANGCDLAICEVGGTIGDIEGLPFIEAIRQLQFDLGKEHVCYIHITLVPFLRVAGELKTKPTQHSVKELRSIGIQPDILLCRSEQELSGDIKAKIGLFCNLSPREVLSLPDAKSIYEVPMILQTEGLDQLIAEKLNIWSRPARMEKWANMLEKLRHPKHTVRIGIVGKYVDSEESYKSLNEALTHAGISNDCRVERLYLDAETIEQGDISIFEQLDGVLVPGGFGQRGTEGKIRAIQIARERKLPFLGICLGLQMAVVEFARNICGLERANSTELDAQTPHPVVDPMPNQRNLQKKGATMRLGAYPCNIAPHTIAANLYAQTQISERHRHRYEVNNLYRQPLQDNGLIISGIYTAEDLVEIIELPTDIHPFFIGCQFHPEFRSRPLQPHPLFHGFISAARKM
jgi:CTP synthase